MLAGCGEDEQQPDEPAAVETRAHGGSAAPADGDRPNLIVIMTDDQTLESFGARAMPFTWRLFQGENASVFQQALAVPPLCCPARAGFLTGQYPHNHGVFGNAPGYPALADKKNTLPAWLDRAGYHTAFIGKYLNSYESVGGMEPAPGWDSWHATVRYPSYFDYQINDNGQLSDYGSSSRDYSTHQLTERALEEIDPERRDGPLFLWLAHNAPHLVASETRPCAGEVPQPPSAGAFREFEHQPLPQDPSFGEDDRSDKPRPIEKRPRLDNEDRELLTLRWRCGLAALRAVDESTERIVEALEDAGELEDTVLVFVSDNGYFFGQHAIDKDKRLPYRAAAHVPMAIRVPARLGGDEAPKEIRELVSTIDLAPTLLDFAGAGPCRGGHNCRAVDGRSLLPLLDGEGGYPADRAILLELNDAYRYEALRTDRYLYSRLYQDRQGLLPTPAVELYDLEADPWELDNLWHTDRAAARPILRDLAPRLEALLACRGSEERRFPRVKAPGDCE